MSTNDGAAAHPCVTASRAAAIVRYFARRRTVASFLQLRDFLIQMGRRDNAAVEVPEVQLLVGRVSVFVRKADAEQYAGHAKLLLKGRNHRNRAALPVEHRSLSEALFHRAPGCAQERVIEPCHPR